MALALAACNHNNKPASQSLVKVNGDEITVHQLNAELAHVDAPNVTKKEVLDGLIARQLLIDQAEKDKLDRDPRVLQAIERSRAQILAQAYLQTKMSNLPKPTEIEVEDFYNKNPQLFAQRKQFDTRELIIDTADLSPDLVKEMNQAHTLDEVRAWLQAHDIKFVPVDTTHTSGDLPPEVVKAVSKMTPGSLFTIKQGDKSQLIALEETRDVPLTLDAARPKIKEFLMLQESKKAADDEIKRLRASADIQYLDKSDVALQGTPPQAAAATPPVASSDAQPGTRMTDVERGITSLK